MLPHQPENVQAMNTKIKVNNNLINTSRLLSKGADIKAKKTMTAAVVAIIPLQIIVLKWGPVCNRA
jgi:hypothetical protein